MIYISIGKTI